MHPAMRAQDEARAAPAPARTSRRPRGCRQRAEADNEVVLLSEKVDALKGTAYLLQEEIAAAAKVTKARKAR